MRIRSIGLLVMLLASPRPSVAGDFDVEGGDQNPLPKALAKVVCQHETFEDCEACEPVGKTIDLGRPAYAFTTADLCNWASTMGPIWVVLTQPKPEVVLFSVGNSLNISQESHHGMKSITIEAGTAGWSGTQQWDFDGQRYIKVSESSQSEADGEAEIDQAPEPPKPPKKAKTSGKKTTRKKAKQPKRPPARKK